MKMVNFKDVSTFEIVRIGGSKDVLFTFNRIDPTTIPDGLYVYDIRHADDLGDPVTIEARVLVNRYGSVITTKPIQCIEDDPDHGYVDIADLSFERITDYDVTLVSIKELYPFHDLYAAFETDWVIDKLTHSDKIASGTVDQIKGVKNMADISAISPKLKGMEYHRMNMVYMLFIDKLGNVFWNRFANPDIDTNEDFEYILTKENPSIRFKFYDDIANRYKCNFAVSYSDTHRVIDIDFYDCITVTPSHVGHIRISIGADQMCVDGSVDPEFNEFKRDLDNFAKDVKFIYNMKHGELWKKSICDIFLEYQYHVADRLVSGKISVIDFLEKGNAEDFVIDELNYSKKIYRIYGDSETPVILIKDMLEKGMCNHMYDWETVEKSRMFYVENCDLQSVDVPSCTDLDEMVDDGYAIIDIV